MRFVRPIMVVAIATAIMCCSIITDRQYAHAQRGLSDTLRRTTARAKRHKPPVYSGPTEDEMNESAWRDFLRTEKRLERTFRQVEQQVNEGVKTGDMLPITRHDLILSERSWLVYRDAQADCEATAAVHHAGDYTMMYYADCIWLNDARIKELKNLLPTY